MALLDFFRRRGGVNKRDNANQVDVRYVGQQKKYTTVTDANEALKNSVVYRGVSIISDAVASIPFNVYHKNKEGYWDLDIKNPLYQLLTKHPNDRMNAHELLEGTIVQLILEGNAYIYIDRDSKYDISHLTLLYPKTVFYNIFPNNYIVNDSYNKIFGTFPADRIIHIRHKSINTLKGESVIRYAGKTVGLSNATDNEALNTMQTGGRFKGILSSESTLTGFSSAIDNQVDTIAQNLQNEIDSGKDILTLQSGASFTPMSQSMRDLMITDIKSITLSDLIRYFGISPVKLGLAMGGNYQAAIQDSLNFYTDTLNPMLRKIEAAFNDKLINTSVSTKYKIEFDRTTLPYFKEILVNYEKMMQLGILSVNDIRKRLNMPFAIGGDYPTVSTNLQFLGLPKVKQDMEEPMIEEELTKDEENKTK